MEAVDIKPILFAEFHFLVILESDQETKPKNIWKMLQNNIF